MMKYQDLTQQKLTANSDLFVSIKRGLEEALAYTEGENVTVRVTRIYVPGLVGDKEEAPPRPA